ncbi:CAAX amino terminal protease self-immunity [Grimontia celer]|uniref:CAAX amino terminal protease self-immunity n=1 Tax=Grimontia celer TaxID=1796497 RepID=A0A128F9I3_9GAMM|nr:type II CAAX endopeptidase family protein [Grimontia celer]CZF83014.1 CAAX amino terminal protease self-immunity [Grimontia celer]
MGLLALLLIAVLSLSFLYPRVIGDRLGFILMLPVIAYTTYFYIDWQVASFFQLFTIALGGVFVGVALLLLGLPMSSPEPKKFVANTFYGFKFLKENKGYLFFQLGITGYEEFIWRAFLISTLMLALPVWAAICLSSVLFWVVHEENRPLGWHSLEFFIFALLLGVAYVVTGSVLFVWIVHLTRNALILSASFYEEHDASLG